MSARKTQSSKPPVFIVGPLRSGSTMLRLLLDHHSRLNIFGEFEGAVSQAIGDQWPEMRKYHEFVRTDRQMQALNLEIDESLDYESLVKSFLHQLDQRSAKPVIGASIHSRMDLLPNIWPEARFIHILRDPRDVARSAIGIGWVGNVHEGARYWLQPESHWDRLCELVPGEQRMEVRYEELVVDPGRHLADICSFLGLQYESGMLEIENDTTYARPDRSYSYQWKRKLSPKEVTWVEYQCKDKLVERGYELSGQPIVRPHVFQYLYIVIQNRFYRTTFNIKRWGVRLWLRQAVAKRFGSSKWKRNIQREVDAITIKHLK